MLGRWLGQSGTKLYLLLHYIGSSSTSSGFDYCTYLGCQTLVMHLVDRDWLRQTIKN